MEMHVTGDITNLMQPNQVAEAKEELAEIEATLNAPPHIRGRISDPRMMQKRRKSLRDELDRYAPRPYAKGELDAAIKEVNGLIDFIQKDMPSSAEMRRNPAGAVGKNISWEKRTEQAVLRYKHVMLRLLATGAVPDNLKHANDAASIERLRSLAGTHDLEDGAQIPKTTDYHFGADIANSVVFSDVEIEVARDLDPEIAGALAIMDQDQRAILKKHIQDILNPPPIVPQTGLERSESWNAITKAATKAGIKTFGRRREEVLADLTAAGISV